MKRRRPKKPLQIISPINRSSLAEQSATVHGRVAHTSATRPSRIAEPKITQKFSTVCSRTPREFTKFGFVCLVVAEIRLWNAGFNVSKPTSPPSYDSINIEILSHSPSRNRRSDRSLAVSPGQCDACNMLMLFHLASRRK